MATNKLQWKRIAKGDRLPCDSLLMKKDGTIPSVVSGAGVTVGQDAYYLPVDDVIEEIRNYPIEESKDEKMRRELVERFSHIKGFDWYGLPIKDIIAWLEKQGEHTDIPAEWSEEDENIYNAILDTIYNNLGLCSIHREWFKNIKERLKSLRPQSHWKPSDEQIEILEHFVRSIGESGYASPYDNNTKLLYSLLSDLKKLMEE